MKPTAITRQTCQINSSYLMTLLTCASARNQDARRECGSRTVTRANKTSRLNRPRRRDIHPEREFRNGRYRILIRRPSFEPAGDAARAASLNCSVTKRRSVLHGRETARGDARAGTRPREHELSRARACGRASITTSSYE